MARCGTSLRASSCWWRTHAERAICLVASDEQTALGIMLPDGLDLPPAQSAGSTVVNDAENLQMVRRRNHHDRRRRRLSEGVARRETFGLLIHLGAPVPCQHTICR